MRIMKISDQCYDWSDTQYPNRFHTGLAPEKEATAQRATSPGGAALRFAHRALQAVRKAGVQMCTGAGTWSKVLPFHQPVRNETSDGLRARRISTASTRISGELPSCARNSQAGLRNQSRTVATASATVEIHHECDAHHPANGFRPRGHGCGSRREHAPGLFSASATTRAERTGRA